MTGRGFNRDDNSAARGCAGVPAVGGSDSSVGAYGQLYMLVEHYRHGPRPVYERGAEHGRMLLEGLHYIDSWPVDDKLDRCFQLIETDDPGLLEQ